MIEDVRYAGEYEDDWVDDDGRSIHEHVLVYTARVNGRKAIVELPGTLDDDDPVFAKLRMESIMESLQELEARSAYPSETVSGITIEDPNGPPVDRPNPLYWPPKGTQ